MTIHEFSPPPVGATLHAMDGQARYLRVDWIMRQEMNGPPHYYCATADWASSPAGRLTAKDVEIASLRAQIADLEAQIAAPPIPPVVAAAATGMVVSNLLDCPDCHRSFRSNQGLAVHRTCSHGGRPPRRPQAAPTDGPAPTLAPPIALVEDCGDWMCRLCLSDAHARDLRQPDYCIRCAAKTQVLNGNGIEARHA